MLSEMRRFFFEEEGEIVEWAVFMLILLAFTVLIITAVGTQAGDMWDKIYGMLEPVRRLNPRQPSGGS